MRIRDWVEALRPRHWVKSGFCFSAVFFSGHAWDPGAWWQVMPVALAFSVLASAGYLLNDVINRQEDRFHPRKRHRPVAAGRIRPRHALAAAAVLLVSGMGVVLRVYGSGAVLAVMCCYVGVTVLYSLWIRNVPVLDVMVLGWGFVLRVIAGAYALGVVYADVHPTIWLIVCTYALALLLGFGKRRAEFLVLKRAGEEVGVTRAALKGYSPKDPRCAGGDVGAAFRGVLRFLLHHAGQPLISPDDHPGGDRTDVVLEDGGAFAGGGDAGRPHPAQRDPVWVRGGLAGPGGHCLSCGGGWGWCGDGRPEWPGTIVPGMENR